MFTISVEFTAGKKTAIAAGARRALWQLREFRDHYGVEPVVTDESRAYTEAELEKLADASNP